MVYNRVITEGTFHEIKLDDFGIYIESIINNLVNNFVIRLKDFKFKCKNMVEGEVNTNKLAECGIPILDYFIYKSLHDKFEIVNFTIDDTIKPLDHTYMLKSLFSIYYLLMIRGKMYLSDNETCTKFILQFIGSDYDISKVKACISRNDLSKVSHKWIKEINVYKMGQILSSRFKSGIAGSRYINIFKEYKPVKVLSINQEKLYNEILIAAERSLFHDHHPLFMASKFKGISLMKNLKNFMLDIYNDEELEKRHERTIQHTNDGATLEEALQREIATIAPIINYLITKETLFVPYWNNIFVLAA
ncbi:MAG: hypothetical protein ACRCZW_08325 [Lactobacillaceae bacterium]